MDIVQESSDAEQILDAALRLGERDGWDAVHLHAIAADLDLPLAAIHRHYAQKDALAEAWFDRADRAMLKAGEMPGWNALPVRERLFRTIAAWLDALEPHRRLTGQMLRYKLHPEHLHLQALGIMRVSRTVQWIREVAAVPTVGWRREIEEAALTAMYLTTFAHWLNDASPGSGRTHALLHRLLGVAQASTLGFDRIFARRGSI
jgi:ubiquinone biosynthesis protein COQ9